MPSISESGVGLRFWATTETVSPTAPGTQVGHRPEAPCGAQPQSRAPPPVDGFRGRPEPLPEVASRARNATPAAPYSAIEMPGTRRSDLFETRALTPPRLIPSPFSTTCRRPHRGWSYRSPPDASRRNGALMARTPLSLVPRAPRVIARMLHAEAAGGALLRWSIGDASGVTSIP